MNDRSDKLCRVFINVLALPVDIDPANIRRSSLASWDSLAQITLVTTIENEFSLMFDADDYAVIDSFEAAAELLRKKDLL